MTDIIYKIEFFTDWHCGSGLTSGSDVDLLVNKDKNGLPYVPGKTLKGLLKEAATVINEYNENKWDQFIKDVFGKQTDNETNESEEGSSRFLNAVLSETLQQKLIGNPHLKETLYRKIAFTAIDNNGTAKQHSLRKMEVTIPLVLYGIITDIPEDHIKDIEFIDKCFSFTKRIGTTRNRGFGRCIITKHEVK